MSTNNTTVTNKPLVTIITVVYNGVDTLERTIKSVVEQTYNRIEYIIVDGGSNDGTKDLILKYRWGIANWISEPDNGLYDAMNKGIAMSTGNFLWFINSGDEIATPDTLEKIFNTNEPADFYYGETIIVDINGQMLGNRRLKPPKKLTWKDFRNGMVVSHQSVIIRKDFCDLYDTSFRFSADYNWVLNALKKSPKTINTLMVLSRFLEGGLTKKNIIPGLKERFRIMVKHFGLATTLLFHIPISLRFFIYYVNNRRF